MEPGNPEFTTDMPGSGPRHMAIDETRKIAYVIHELKSLVVIFSIEPHTGDLVRRGDVDILEHSPIPVQNHTWPYQVNLGVQDFKVRLIPDLINNNLKN